MKHVSKLAAAVTLGIAFALAPVAHAQTAKTGAMAMDTDKDGMVSKAEFMKMAESKFDAMDKSKSGKLTPQQVQQAINDIVKTYGTNQ